MIDTRANKCIIHDSLAPTKFRHKLKIPIKIRQFNGTCIEIVKCLQNIPIKINGEIHNLPQTFISNKTSRHKFILGSNFILGNNGSLLSTPIGVNFLKKIYICSI